MKRMQMLLGVAASLVASVLGAAEKPADWVLGEEKNDTVVQIQMKAGSVVDACTGKAVSEATGITSATDPEMGEVMRFDATGKGGIYFRTKTPVDALKGKGVTIEAWVKPNEDLSGGLFLIWGMGNVVFKSSKVTASYLTPSPTQSIYVEPGMEKKRFKYYPSSLKFNGIAALKKGEWNHVAIVYDEKMKMIRSWINGQVDRELEIYQDEAYFKFNPDRQHQVLTGLKNTSVAGLRIRAGAHHPTTPPAMKHYLNQLPWQNKMVLTVDKIERSLPFPMTLTATLEGLDVVQTKTLKTYQETVHFEFARPDLPAADRTVRIQAKAGGKMVYDACAVYNNNPVPKNGKVRINKDMSLSYDGKKIFPIILYSVLTNDLQAVADLGFSCATPKDANCRWYVIPSREIDMMMRWVNVAVEKKLYLNFCLNNGDKNINEYIPLYKKQPKMLYWYNASEPWKNWTKYEKQYHLARQLCGEFPVLSVQCRSMHMKNTAVSCDIMGCDPYPIPACSLRGVADMTKATSVGSFGLKPVWTVLPCYVPKIPTQQELRCMTVIALASGANGLGLYAWDERTMRNRNKYCAANRPDVIALMKDFVSDVRSVESILVEPNLKIAVSDAKKNPAIHAALKKANGKTYLLLANDQRCPEKATLKLPKGFTQAVPLKAFGFANTLAIQNGTCETTLPALAAGIFELK